MLSSMNFVQLTIIYDLLCGWRACMPMCDATLFKTTLRFFQLLKKSCKTSKN